MPISEPVTAAIEKLQKSVEKEESANRLGVRIWWLNLWLFVCTIAICGLTVVIMLAELGVLRVR